MWRIFGIVAAVSISMIMLAGGGIYGFIAMDVDNSKREAAKNVVDNLATSLSEQVETLQMSVDGLARLPDVIAALDSGRPEIIKATADKLQSAVPYSLRVRLLLPNVSDVDESESPHMGYGDLDMIRATVTSQPSPVIQGEAGDRHLAVTSAVRNGERVVGVVLASLDADWPKRVLVRNRFKDGLIELSQDRLVLVKLGSVADREDEPVSVPVTNTRWVVNSWIELESSLGDISVLASLFVVPSLLVCLAFFIAYRKLFDFFREDQSSVLKAAKDLIQGKHVGNYPMKLEEMQPIITAMVQFKRVISNEIPIPLGTSNEAADDFFEESIDFDGLEDVKPVAVPKLEKSPVKKPKKSRVEKVEFGYEVQEDIGVSSANDSRPKPVKVESPIQKPERSNIPENSKIPESWDMNADEIAVPDWNLDKETPSVPDSWDMDIGAPLVSEKAGGVPKSAKSKAIGPSSAAAAGIFRGEDISGVVGKDLNEDMVACIGRAFASEAKQLQVKTVVVARDGRLSSPVLAEALISGIVSTGCDVLDLGLVPMPVMCFVAHHTEGRSGLMLTGGDQPGNYNGFKMVLQGQPFSKQQIQALKARIDNGRYDSDEPGSVEQNAVFSNEYIGIIAEDIRVARPMTVVVDSGNGATGSLGPELLRTLGCDVVELNCDIDGQFPAHFPDPSDPSNLEALRNAVTLNRADLGIAFDGDGSRMGLVDSAGRIVWADRQTMLLARDALSGKVGAEIIFDAGCSKHLSELIKKRGGQPVLWNSGRVALQTHLRETGAAMAADMDGHFLFRDRWFGFADALYAAARTVAILSNDARPSAEVFDQLPSSPCTPEIRVPMAEAEISGFINQVVRQAKFNNVYSIKPEGMRVEFPDGWGLIKASSRSALLLLRFEADSEEAMLRIQSEFKALMLKIKPNLTLPF
ncbi:MAG: phosphomannomutase/phosphoglucomutase [Gammaproteobacteria bacterium]